jgi:hypothetical protein
MKTNHIGETKAMESAREREQYWRERRTSATTMKELNYARKMETKAAHAYSIAEKKLRSQS